MTDTTLKASSIRIKHRPPKTVGKQRQREDALKQPLPESSYARPSAKRQMQAHQKDLGTPGTQIRALKASIERDLRRIARMTHKGHFDKAALACATVAKKRQTLVNLAAKQSEMLDDPVRPETTKTSQTDPDIHREKPAPKAKMGRSKPAPTPKRYPRWSDK